jgi:UDP-N-acetylglucosamine acyltransferase
MTTLRAGIDPGAKIHPAAFVDPGATIAAGCVIGPGCVVGPGAVLEEGVELAAHVVIDGIARLGAGVKVSPFATIGLPPQDLKYKGEPTGVSIGARTQIREHATIHRGSTGGDGWTRIGANCLIMCVAHVAHDCTLGDGVILVNNVMLAGHVEVGDGAMIQGGAAVQQFVRIGRMALVAGMAGVERSVLPFGRVKGHRASFFGLNALGMVRRLGMTRGQVAAVEHAVHELYAGRPRDQVEAVAAAHAGDVLVTEILDFARGVFARPRGRNMLCPYRRGPEEEENGEGA